jgi:hypothetical protein
MAWLAQQYSAAGVDLLWWTDHAEFFFRRLPDFVVRPARPSQVQLNVWSIGTWGYTGEGTVFLRSDVAPLVDSVGGHVQVDLPALAIGVVDTIELFFGIMRPSGPRRAALGAMSRPMVGQPRFTMSVWPVDAAGEFPHTKIVVPLAWHPRGSDGYRPYLEYNWDASLTSGWYLRGDTVKLDRSWVRGDSATIAIDPGTDAAVFPDGLDNTTDEYRVRFYLPRSPTRQQLRFSFPRIANQVSTAAVEIPPVTDVSHSLAQAFGVRTMIGMEFGPQPGPIAGTKWHATSGAGAHMTFFLPNDLPPSLESSIGGEPPAYSALANSLGGVTAIAHPFGVSTSLLNLTADQQAQEARDLGSFLVQNKGWGASLIEIGLVRRGGVGIRTHLDLLDYLWASGLRLCPTAVTDAHGGLLTADPSPGSGDEHNFVTWLGDVDRVSDGQDLISAMRRCDMSFGNPFYTRGGMWLNVETDPLGRQILIFDADGVSPSATLYMFEVEIDSTGVGHDPVYRHYSHLVPRGLRPPVGGCKPGFARLEAWVGDRPLAFSNVVPIAPVPSACPAPVR